MYQPINQLELDDDKPDAFNQPDNPPVVFYAQNQLIFSATHKQDQETFALDASTGSANVSNKVGEKVSQSITVSEISALN